MAVVWRVGVRQRGVIRAEAVAGALFAELTAAAAPTPLQIVLALLVTGAVATLGAAAGFRASDRRAKDRGLLDQTTGS